MSIQPRVQGYRSADEIYQKHERVLQVCKENGVSLPAETAEYFGVSPNNVNFDPILGLKTEVPYKTVDVNQSTGVEIMVFDIPEGVTKIWITIPTEDHSLKQKRLYESRYSNPDV